MSHNARFDGDRVTCAKEVRGAIGTLNSVSARQIGTIGEFPAVLDHELTNQRCGGQFAMMKNGKLVLSPWADVEKTTRRPIE